LQSPWNPGRPGLTENIFTRDICKVLLNKDHTTCGKERFIGTRLQDCHSFQVQSEAAWLKMGSGLYRRGKPMREGERLWSLIICDHHMEQVNMPS
jgi:hypothetical protein